MSFFNLHAGLFTRTFIFNSLAGSFLRASSLSRYFIYALLHFRAAPFVRCFICALLRLRAASLSRYLIYALLHFRAVPFVRFFICALLHMCAASFARYFICAPLHLRAVTFTRCVIYTRLHYSAASFTRWVIYCCAVVAPVCLWFAPDRLLLRRSAYGCTGPLIIVVPVCAGPLIVAPVRLLMRRSAPVRLLLRRSARCCAGPLIVAPTAL